MYELWLFLHILGAIAAFGFGFYAPIFGSAAAREPQHGNWYLRATKRVSNGVLVPVAISMAITGTLLVVETGGMRRFEQLWLTDLGRPLRHRAAHRLPRPAAGPRQGHRADLRPAARPAGPPAEVPALLRRLRLLGLRAAASWSSPSWR